MPVFQVAAVFITGTRLPASRFSTSFSDSSAAQASMRMPWVTTPMGPGEMISAIAVTTSTFSGSLYR